MLSTDKADSTDLVFCLFRGAFVSFFCIMFFPFLSINNVFFNDISFYSLKSLLMLVSKDS